VQLRGTTPSDHYQRESIRSPRGRNEVIAPEILPSRKTRYSRDNRWKSNAGIARERERDRCQTPRPQSQTAVYTRTHRMTFRTFSELA